VTSNREVIAGQKSAYATKPIHARCPGSPFLANFRADDSKDEALGLFDWARTRDEYTSRARNNYSVLDKTSRPNQPPGAGH
jgi:hypothetical protein